MLNRRRFKLNICPAIENILSTHAEEAWTLRYFFANSAKGKKFCSFCLQNSKAHEILLAALYKILNLFKKKPNPFSNTISNILGTFWEANPNTNPNIGKKKST